MSTSKTLRIAAAAAITIAFAASAFAAESSKAGTEMQTALDKPAALKKATWLKTVAAANFFEIETSKVALEKSQNEDIKTFAQEMIDDHTKAAEKLAVVLQQEGTELPPRALAPKQDDALALLKKADGKDFDAAYLGVQRGAHIEAVSIFSTYAAQPDDPALAAFARETLPTLEKHLEHVKMIIEP